MQHALLVHTLFDLLAASVSLAVTFLAYRWRLSDYSHGIEQGGAGYVLALIGGAVAGGYGFGTANLWISGVDSFGRSIAGAFLGAVFVVEMFKQWRGIKGSTGLLFVPGFATSVVIGRWGCFFSGLHDHTHGVATTMPWGVDLGDGVLRHPVQLYESGAMAVFLLVAGVLIWRKQPFFMRNGFYLLAIWYGGQRFFWEFLKPYSVVIGPFNLFHFVCLALILYGLWMIYRGQARV